LWCRWGGHAGSVVLGFFGGLSAEVGSTLPDTLAVVVAGMSNQAELNRVAKRVVDRRARHIEFVGDRPPREFGFGNGREVLTHAGGKTTLARREG